MYISMRQLKRLPVMSLQDDGVIGYLEFPIIDLGSLHIEGFTCNALEKTGRQVLVAADIRQLNGDYLIIDSAEDLSDLEEIVRLREALRDHYTPIGQPVVSDVGRKLGKVTDFSVNIESLRLQKLFVKPPFLAMMQRGLVIIDRTQIIDVNAERITVRDVTVKSDVIAGETFPQSTT